MIVRQTELEARRVTGDQPLSDRQWATVKEDAHFQALQQYRAAGVPIYRNNGRYELPDGEIVDHDPWHGAHVAPDGWYEKYGIAPEDRPPIDPFAFLKNQNSSSAEG